MVQKGGAKGKTPYSIMRAPWTIQTSSITVARCMSTKLFFLSRLVIVITQSRHENIYIPQNFSNSVSILEYLMLL